MKFMQERPVLTVVILLSLGGILALAVPAIRKLLKPAADKVAKVTGSPAA